MHTHSYITFTFFVQNASCSMNKIEGSFGASQKSFYMLHFAVILLSSRNLFVTSSKAEMGRSPSKLHKLLCLYLSYKLSHCFSLSVYLPFFPSQTSLWSGSDLCRDCLHTAKLVAPLWMGFSQGHVRVGRLAREHRGRMCSVTKMCAGLLWEATWSEGLARRGTSTREHRYGAHC